jgi:hypothetical protein
MTVSPIDLHAARRRSQRWRSRFALVLLTLSALGSAGAQQQLPWSTEHQDESFRPELDASREPKLPEYIASKSYVFRVDVDGRITAYRQNRSGN